VSIADGELTSLALCWRLERTDGAGIGLTSHDQAIESVGVQHQATPGILPAAVTRTLGLEPHSAEVAGALSSEALDAADLPLGRWDGAKVSLSAVDRQNPEADPIQLLGGEIGSVSIRGDSFSADLRGVAAKLGQPVCPATSAECRAELGDEQCRVDLAGRTSAAQVVSSNGGELVLDQAFDDRFVLGRLRFMGGANCGISTVILAVNNTTVVVRDLPRAPIEAGCRIELREGCDKRFETCVGRFANAVNFRGEPHLPGNDADPLPRSLINMAIDYAERARALVGTRFRPQGRGVDGLDCIGVVIATYGLDARAVRNDYRLRGHNLREVEASLIQHFRGVPARAVRPGDVIVMSVATNQLHVGVRTEAGFVHAHAGIRRVVETPGAPQWTILSGWRRRARARRG